MSAQANITVFDGAPTPVSHVLIASGVKVLSDGTQLAIYREQLSSLPVKAQVRVEARQREFPTGVVETRFDVFVPVMESISGQNAAGYTAAPKVAYEDRFALVQYAHPRSTLASRRLAKQIGLNLGNNVSTSVAAVSAGIVDEASAQLVFPS